MASNISKGHSVKGKESAKRLMVAAIDLFSEHDYASVTIQDVTKRAGVAHSLVYYHFKNKEDLFNKGVTNLINMTIKSYQESRKHHHDPVDLIDDWFENNIRLAPDLRKLVKIMFNYSGSRQGFPSVADSIRDFYREEHTILAASVKKGIDEGHFKDVDPIRVASLISTHIDGIFYNSFIRDRNDIVPDMHNLKWALWSILDYAQADSDKGEGKNQLATLSYG